MNNLYKIDMHVHTSESSLCGNLSAKDTVQSYIKAGYCGICITDHYVDYYFASQDKASQKVLSWEEHVSIYLKGYHAALEEAEKDKEADFSVFLGMEYCSRGSGNEYLVYGITEEFLYNNPELYKLSVPEFLKLAKQENFLVFQAHPFRPGMTTEKIPLLDGIEVFNGNPRHNSKNGVAYELARELNKKMISGSDCHEIGDVGIGGILVNKKIETNVQLVEMLAKSDYMLLMS